MIPLLLATCLSASAADLRLRVGLEDQILSIETAEHGAAFWSGYYRRWDAYYGPALRLGWQFTDKVDAGVRLNRFRMESPHALQESRTDLSGYGAYTYPMGEAWSVVGEGQLHWQTWSLDVDPDHNALIVGHGWAAELRSGVRAFPVPNVSLDLSTGVSTGTQIIQDKDGGDPLNIKNPRSQFGVYLGLSFWTKPSVNP